GRGAPPRRTRRAGRAASASPRARAARLRPAGATRRDAGAAARTDRKRAGSPRRQPGGCRSCWSDGRAPQSAYEGKSGGAGWEYRPIALRVYIRRREYATRRVIPARQKSANARFASRTSRPAPRPAERTVWRLTFAPSPTIPTHDARPHVPLRPAPRARPARRLRPAPRRGGRDRDRRTALRRDARGGLERRPHGVPPHRHALLRRRGPLGSARRPDRKSGL